MPELLGPYTGVPLNRMPKLSYMDKEGVPAMPSRLALGCRPRSMPTAFPS